MVETAYTGMCSYKRKYVLAYINFKNGNLLGMP